jgi:hypothetical protein
LTLDEIHKHPAYAGLSPEQKKYVDGRCAGLDKVAAANASWKAKDDRSARAMANQAERKSKVKWLIEQFWGLKHIPDREEMAGQFWEWALEAKDPKAQADFAKLTVQVLGYAIKPTEQPPEPPAPNDGDEAFQL